MVYFLVIVPHSTNQPHFYTFGSKWCIYRVSLLLENGAVCDGRLFFWHCRFYGKSNMRGTFYKLRLIREIREKGQFSKFYIKYCCLFNRNGSIFGCFFRVGDGNGPGLVFTAFSPNNWIWGCHKTCSPVKMLSSNLPCRCLFLFSRNSLGALVFYETINVGRYPHNHMRFSQFGKWVICKNVHF